MSICIFPGTFNPIHNAHIKMAEFALEKYKFDKIIFIPSGFPPHKEIDKSLAQHRFNMVKLAVKNNPKFEVSDIEYSSEGKSYSLITVQKIIKLYKIENRLNFIIGTDAFVKIKTWYNADELKNLVHFIVFPREGTANDEALKQLKKEGWDFELADFEKINLSSTEVRSNHNKGINEQIEDYIRENGLYKY